MWFPPISRYYIIYFKLKQSYVLGTYFNTNIQQALHIYVPISRYESHEIVRDVIRNPQPHPKVIPTKMSRLEFLSRKSIVFMVFKLQGNLLLISIHLPYNLFFLQHHLYLVICRRLQKNTKDGINWDKQTVCKVLSDHNRICKHECPVISTKLGNITQKILLLSKCFYHIFLCTNCELYCLFLTITLLTKEYKNDM